MPSYKPLKTWTDKTTRNRTIDKLLAIRQKIANEIPPKTARQTLLIATWNIREFSDNRMPESLYYLAEIIDAFDFVAIQEVSSNMEGLQDLMKLLGSNWQYIVTDATAGSAGGGERMAFLYDLTKVSFRNIAGEVVLPKGIATGKGEVQFARTPFLAAFQAGWFRFTICTVHIYYGKDTIDSPELKRRVDEIKTIGNWFNKKSRNENSNYILLGDFNIVDDSHPTMEALKKTGFYLPDDIKDKPTDLGGTKHYDQIAFRVKDEDMLIFNKRKGQAGTFHFTDIIMKDDELGTYKPFMDAATIADMTEKQLQNYYLSKWRTFQISDHLPLWVELQIDFSEEYLQSVKEEAPPVP